MVGQRYSLWTANAGAASFSGAAILTIVFTEPMTQTAWSTRFHANHRRGMSKEEISGAKVQQVQPQGAQSVGLS